MEAGEREAARRTAPPGMGNPIPPAFRSPPPLTPLPPNPIQNQQEKKQSAPKHKPNWFSACGTGGRVPVLSLSPPRFASLPSGSIREPVPEGGREVITPRLLHLSVHFHSAQRFAGSDHRKFDPACFLPVVLVRSGSDLRLFRSGRLRSASSA